MLMTGAGHRAVLAVAAAAYHRLTLLFLFDHADDDRRDDRDQHRTDNDRADIIRYPCKHTFHSFLSHGFARAELSTAYLIFTFLVSLLAS